MLNVGDGSPSSRDSIDLATASREDGILLFSAARPYNMPEEDYDKYYARSINPEGTKLLGKRIRDFLTLRQAPRGGTVLEIGAGTGRVSSSLVASEYFDAHVITDGSFDFARICRKNVLGALDGILDVANIKPGVLEFGVLLGEDIKKLRENSVECVALYAVLHHFVDWRSIIADVYRVLKPNGFLILREPCIDFGLVSSVMLRTFQQNSSYDVDSQDSRKITAFINSMKFRSNDNIDKAKVEDKYMFRIEDILEASAQIGFAAQAFPNSDFGVNKQSFRDILYVRLTRVNGMSEELIDRLFEYFSDSMEDLEEFYSFGAGPNFDCLYYLHKAI